MEVAHLGLLGPLLCLMLGRIEWWISGQGRSFTGGLAQKGVPIVVVVMVS